MMSWKIPKQQQKFYIVCRRKRKGKNGVGMLWDEISNKSWQEDIES